MAHGEASGGPVLPPQRRSLQQRFGPHARARDGRGTVRRLLALYARWGRELLLVVCLTLLSTGAALAVPYLLGRAVDCFLPWGGVERAALSVLLPTLAGAAAAQWLGNWGRRRWMEILSQRMVARIRRECFAKLGRLPLSYFDRHPHGDTMNRLVSDADNVSTVAAETVTQLLSSLLMVAGALAIMAALSPLLTLTALATVPVIALCTRLISRRSRTLYRRQADELGRLSGLVQESLSNSRTVKLYHQQEELRRPAQPAGEHGQQPGLCPDRLRRGRAGPPRRGERWAGGQLPGLLPAVGAAPEQHCRPLFQHSAGRRWGRAAL